MVERSELKLTVEVNEKVKKEVNKINEFHFLEAATTNDIITLTRLFTEERVNVDSLTTGKLHKGELL